MEAISMEEGISWLWKVTDAERLYEPYTTSYRLTVATSKPLHEEHFVLTLTHLFRKVPSLRTCFGERNGERWLREMSDEMIDFELQKPSPALCIDRYPPVITVWGQWRMRWSLSWLDVPQDGQPLLKMETQSEWLFELSSMDLEVEPFSLSYQLTLVSREPLLEEHLMASLRHLFRKVPCLRTCFGKQNGKTWMREMSHEKIDFEMVAGVKSDDLHNSLQKYKYNKQTGPLWCVKLRPEFSSSPDNVVIEETEGFPHMYSLFIGINHVITDGTTNGKICGFLVQLLDDVIAGKAIDDEEQLGVFMSNKETKKLLDEHNAEINADPVLKRELIEAYKALQEKQACIKSLSERPKGTEAKSGMLLRNLDTETTSALIKLCRAEGVTVNSAFTAAANLALVDILEEGGFEEDVHNVRSGHVVNARRYWEGDTSRALGCHILLLPIQVETSRSHVKEFWDYARSLNEKIHAKLKSGTPFQDRVLKTFKIEGPNPAYECEFYVTNMGDLTKAVAKGGNHVQAVHVLRASTLEGTPCALINLVHTFREKLVITLVYNEAFVTSQLIEKYYERLFQHFKAII